jgi:RNA polymerase sigma-70 factor (ECF subfamily)
MLAARVAAGDRAAFAALYDAYAGAAFSLACGVCASRHLAAEDVAEAFGALWRDPSVFDPQRNGFATWLLRLVHRRGVEALQRETEQHPSRAATTHRSDHHRGTRKAEVDVTTLAGLADADLRKTLRSLSPEDRQLLLLAYLGGYTHTQIAALTGLSPETITLSARRGDPGPPAWPAATTCRAGLGPSTIRQVGRTRDAGPKHRSARSAGSSADLRAATRPDAGLLSRLGVDRQPLT